MAIREFSGMLGRSISVNHFYGLGVRLDILTFNVWGEMRESKGSDLPLAFITDKHYEG